MNVFSWFPGHMNKTLKQLESFVNMVDIVIEIRDARAPLSTKNHLLEKINKNKKHIIILSKIDLADKIITQKWINYFNKNNIICIPLDMKNGSIKELLRKLNLYLLKKKLKVIVVGIPNSGKSTLINKLSNKKISQVQDLPGVTKKIQWYKSYNGIYILDTPGLLWNKIDKLDIGIKLALIGSIKENIIDNEEQLVYLLEYLKCNYLKDLSLILNLEIDEIHTKSTLELINILALKRNFHLKNKEIIDYNFSNKILREFRKGKLGKFSLDKIN